METQNKERRNKSKRRELAESGALMAAYSQKSFIKIYPAFDIEKVKISFADIGSNGKGFDIYVDMDDFDILCEDILSMNLKRAILSEKQTAQNPYPYSWRYVTGNSAEKEIRISKGMKSEVNIYGKHGSEKKNIPLSYNELRIMAKYFKRVSEKHFDMLTELTLKGMEENAKYFKMGKDDARYEKIENETEETTPTQEKNEEKTSENDVVTLKTVTEVRKINETMFCLDVIETKSEQQTQLYFNQNSINALGEQKWSKLQDDSKKSRLVLNIHAQKNKGAYLFMSMAA